MATVRVADVVWTGGDLKTGSGVVSAMTSGAFQGLPVSWSSRAGEANGQTSPEELIAAAHASCFAMALSAGLGREGMPPDRLEVSAAVTFDKVGDGFRVVSSALKVRGWAQGMNAARFQQAAEGAKDGCPVSQALKGNVQISVEATLES